MQRVETLGLPDLIGVLRLATLAMGFSAALHGQVNVVACGNDSSVDDSPVIVGALTQPITQSPATANIALIPANATCYANLSGVNSIPAGSRLMGVPGKSVIKPFTIGNPIIQVAGASASNTISGVSIEGITFDASGSNLSSSSTALVSVVWADDFRFVNNIIRSRGDVTTGEALRLLNVSGLVQNNDISNFATQVEVFADSAANIPPNSLLTISQNRIYNNSSGGGNGIFIHGGASSPIDIGVVIEGNYISATQTSSASNNQSGNSVLVFAAQKVRISHNYSTSPQGSCFRSTFSNEMIFTGNQCSGPGGPGMVSEAASQHNQWVNNFVENAAGACMSLVTTGNSGTVQSHTIIGNHLVNCGTWGIAVEADAVVTGNLVDHAVTGIQAGYLAGKNITVSDNLIVDTNAGGNGATQIGIGIAAGVSGPIILEGNQFDLGVTTIAGLQSNSLVAIPAGVTVRNQSVPQAMLGSADPGSSVYCPNCASGNCATSGSGSFARKTGQGWQCE